MDMLCAAAAADSPFRYCRDFTGQVLIAAQSHAAKRARVEAEESAQRLTIADGQTCRDTGRNNTYRLLVRYGTAGGAL